MCSKPNEWILKMILDPTIDDIAGLSNEDLERLVFLLAEAEMSKCAGKLTDVSGSGRINAPDAGIDVSVNITGNYLASEFVPRPFVGFQVKNTELDEKAIEKEMCPKRKFRNSISNLAVKSGSYIIASTNVLSKDSRDKRVTKMQEVAEKYMPNNSLTLRFYDLTILNQWLRQHPSVILWVNSIKGKNNFGWDNFGNWSRPIPNSPFLMGNGISIELPNRPRVYQSIEEGVNEVREMIRSSNRAIRIVGLSGVGKTRFVQALFEEDIGENQLDRTNVIYNDVGRNPNNFVEPMIRQLHAQNQSPIMVLDNCPTFLHNEISSQILDNKSKIKLLTVEYDIREDTSHNTDIVKMSNDAPDLAMDVILKQYPSLDKSDAIKIAKLAGGNFRISIAIAEQVEKYSGSLAKLSEEELFKRLFLSASQIRPTIKCWC